jgi:hypothetical protein
MTLNDNSHLKSTDLTNGAEDKSKDVFNELEFVEVSTKLSGMTDFELENLFNDMEKDENGKVRAKAFGDALKALLYGTK